MCDCAYDLSLMTNLFSRYMPTNDVDYGASARAMKSTINVATNDAALEASTKAACLLVLNRASQDPRFLDAAHSRYSNALIRTRRQLETKGIDRRTLLGTAHFLSLCEAFNSTSVESIAARPHTMWFVSLLESCHGDPVYGVLLGSPMRVFAVWELLVARQLPPNVKAPTLDNRSTDQPGSLEMICNLAVNVIALSGGKPESSLSTPESLERLQTMAEFEGRLHRWLSGYYEQMPKAQYRIADSPFTKQSPNVLLLTSTLFRKCFVLPNIMATMTHMLYWMCMALLAGSRHQLLTKRKHEFDVDDLQLKATTSTLVESLDNIAMSMPYTKEKECGWSGRLLAIRPIHFLVIGYKELQDWDKVAWCLQCAAELKIVRPVKTSHHPT